ncbi:hypothetical protein HMPREF1861_01018 [Corynebacterium kroppenstedtii]|nr:hypothetical protein HMPREF1861_01018 [Corynebacterium kroppenstedtii]
MINVPTHTKSVTHHIIRARYESVFPCSHLSEKKMENSLPRR